MAEIDELMDEDPLKLTKEKLDGIIAYHRKVRADRASGVKTKTRKETGPKLSLAGLLKAPMSSRPKAPEMKRRV